MRPRLAAGLVALLALFVAAAPAWAQDEERPKGVEKVYDDYEDDGVIEACDHTQRALQRTLEQLPPEADVETPDLRPALEAAIEQVQQNNCPTPTPTPTPTPSPTTTPAPTATPGPTAPPDSGGDDETLGTVPPAGGGGGGDGTPPGREDVTPLEPEVTPVPPAQTPAPGTQPPEPSGPAATPAPVYANSDDSVPVALLVLGGLAALIALLALLYAALSRLGWAERPLARVRRAWREAAFRLGGTWGDFSDWMRVGR